MAENTQQLGRLKQKYQPALNLAQQLGVQLQNVNLSGEKLFIRGAAPSSDVKNKVWDQIKLIDPNYSDLVLDLSISQQQQQQQPPVSMTAGASIAGGQNQRRYTVRSGDTLSKISRDFYGNANEYMKIFEANRHVLQDPNKISPGQDLFIPE